MFGLGPLEIAALVGILVFFLGVPRAGRLLGNIFRGWRKVEDVKGRMRTPFSLKHFLLRVGRGKISGD